MYERMHSSMFGRHPNGQHNVEIYVFVFFEPHASHDQLIIYNITWFIEDITLNGPLDHTAHIMHIS